MENCRGGRQRGKRVCVHVFSLRGTVVNGSVWFYYEFAFSMQCTFCKIPLHLPLCLSMFSSTVGKIQKKKKVCGLEPVRVAELQH